MMTSTTRPTDSGDSDYIALFDKLIKDDEAEREQQFQNKLNIYKQEVKDNYSQLLKENEKLKCENEKLRAEVASLLNKNKKLMTEMEKEKKSQGKMESLNSENEVLKQKITKIYAAAFSRKSETFTPCVDVGTINAKTNDDESKPADEEIITKTELLEKFSTKRKKGGTTFEKSELNRSVSLEENSMSVGIGTEGETEELENKESKVTIILTIANENEEMKRDEKEQKLTDLTESTDEKEDIEQDKFETETQPGMQFKRTGSVRDRIKSYQSLIQMKSGAVKPVNFDGNNNEEKRTYARRRPFVTQKMTL